MKTPADHFGKEHAASYEARFAKLAPLNEALHLLIRIHFGNLPENARILCVGAGAGAELIALGRAFPAFTFTAVEPSEPMLDVCRQRAAEEGIADRCVFHAGYLQTLPPTAPFDAATALLVSQFLTDRNARIAFFAQIAERLRPGAPLISSDLCGNLDTIEQSELRPFWTQMLRYSGNSEEQTQNYLKAWREHVGILPPAEVAQIIAAGGFTRPTVFYQSLFIHAFLSQREERANS